MKKIQMDATAKAELQRNKRNLQRERRRNEERALNAAKESLNTAAVRASTAARTKNANGVRAFTIAHTRAVMHSFGVNVPINVEERHGSNPSAFMDWRSINVRMPNMSRPDLTTMEMISYIASLRGLIYHELGHFLYSPKFDDFANIDVLVPWCVENDPVLLKKRFEEEQSRTPTPTEMTHEYAQYYAQNKRSIHRCWNMMEDQRMESAMVRKSPIMGRYFSAAWALMVDRDSGYSPENALLKYALLVCRNWAPDELVEAARQNALQSWPEQVTSMVAEITQNYCAATTTEELLHNVMRMHLLMWELGVSVVPSSDHSVEDHRPKDKDETEKKLKETATPEGGESGAATDEEEEEEEEEERPTSKDKPHTVTEVELPTKGEGDAGEGDGDDEDEQDGSLDAEDEESLEEGGKNEGESSKWEEDKSVAKRARPEAQKERWTHRDTLTQHRREMAQDILSELKQDKVMQELVRDLQQSIDEADDSLCIYEGRIPSDSVVNDAHVLSAQLADALRAAWADDAPIWQSRQPRGVLDPFHYRTRAIGDRDFYRSLSGSGDLSMDLSVSLLLDISGSMGGSSYDLAVVGLACRLACGELGIPCTVSAFDHNGYLLYGPFGEVTPVQPNCHGGTDPTTALEAVARQGYGAGTHLVIVMTDGQFESIRFPKFFLDGRDIWLGLGYGRDSHAYAQVWVKHLEEAGCPNTAAITSLDQIALHLKSLLISHT